MDHEREKGERKKKRRKRKVKKDEATLGENNFLDVSLMMLDDGIQYGNTRGDDRKTKVSTRKAVSCHVSKGQHKCTAIISVDPFHVNQTSPLQELV